MWRVNNRNNNYNVIIFVVRSSFRDNLHLPNNTASYTNKLQSSNISEQLDLNENANPNDNFELFMNRVTTFKQQCIPKKTVRYNKKVHKDNPWITNGILKSINSKCKLYKALIKTQKESPNYAVL